MRIIHQVNSNQLREQFQKQIAQHKRSVNLRKQKNFLDLLTPILGIDDISNSIKGYMGETITSWSLAFEVLPDTWICFPNALIPVGDRLTEIDRLIVSPNGVFLIEVKNWAGSFAAYRDNWKRREGNQWIPIENSPTKQSFYHQKCFYKWIRPLIPGLPSNFVSAPVVFLSAKWIGAKELSVPVLKGLSSLRQFLMNSSQCLSLEQVNQIVEVVTQP